VVAVRCRHVSPTHAWLEIVFAHEALVHLGFFSFNKLLMHRDLAVDAWPENALATHSLTRGLLYEGFEGEEPALRPEDRLDEVLPPEKLFHVVDADASQATVIEEARRGRNLVVQGPPGTGKSQTITNIIAAAASEGKRVLFLAEKMAALSVVYERLVKSGLRDVCLELHSKAANKKSTLGEIGRTLSQASATANVPGPPTALKDARDRLNDLTNLLHRQIGTSGETPYSVLGRQSLFLGTRRPPPSLDSDAITQLSREQEAALIELVRAYGRLCSTELNEPPHPFEGARNLDLQPVDLRRLEGLAGESCVSATALATAVRAAFALMGAEGPVALKASAELVDTLDRLKGLPANGKAFAQLACC
jgi:hypothetical protein